MASRPTASPVDADANGESTVRAVERVLDILDCFRDHPDLTLSELSARTDLSKSTVHRLLRVLERRGAVMRDPATQRFSIGSMILSLAATFGGPARLQQLARPVMEALGERTGETVALSLRIGDQRIVLDQVQSPHQLRRSVEIGKAQPLHAGSSGKAILAFLEPSETTQIIRSFEARAFIQGGSRKTAALGEELARSRSRGYAVARGQPEGITSLAAPIFNAKGRPIAALSVSGPSQRFTAKAQQRIALALIEAARNLSRTISAEADPAGTHTSLAL